MKSGLLAVAVVVPGGSLLVGGFFLWRWMAKRSGVSKLSDALTSIMPHASAEDVADFAPAIYDAMRSYEIATPRQQAAFLGELAEESNELWHLRDHYGTPRGEEYASGSAYEGRADLGNTEDGDGPLFKGRGLIQCTGRANYQTATDTLGHDFISSPADMNLPEWSARYAAAYFCGLNPRGLDCRDLATAGNLTTITKVINGGTNGLKDRLAYAAAAQSALGDEGSFS